MEIRFKRIKDGYHSVDTTTCDSLEAAADHYKLLEARGYAVIPYSVTDGTETEYWMDSDGVLKPKV